MTYEKTEHLNLPLWVKDQDENPLGMRGPKGSLVDGNLTLSVGVRSAIGLSGAELAAWQALVGGGGGGGGQSFVFALVNGVWATIPAISRLALTGSGTISIDSRDAAGNITTAVFTQTVAGATGTVFYPFYGAAATQIRASLPGGLAAEVF